MSSAPGPEVLVIIPARGGSRSIPRKNLREIAGVTLVARAVWAAREASLVNRVVGSTEDPEIASELLRAGAEVPGMRPAELATDLVADTPVFLHVLEMLAAEGYRPDLVVNVRPTAPLRTGADIDAAIAALMARPDAPSLKSVSPVGEHPYKMWSLGSDAVLAPVLPEWHDRLGGDPDLCRQKLPPVYRSNGAVDVTRVPALLATGRLHPGPVLAFVMSRQRAVDIDDEEDVAMAGRRLEQMRTMPWPP